MKKLTLVFLALSSIFFLSLSPLVEAASACINHAQCSEACDYLGYGNCPPYVYGCMIRNCCLGQCNLNTGECFCLHTNTVDIYGRVCPEGSTCGNDCRCHPQRVCTPGDIRNEKCACSSQVGYDECNSEGTAWVYKIKTCPEGSVCDNGKCVPKKVCTPGETRNRDCACSSQTRHEECNAEGSGWVPRIENCPSGYICENGYCVPEKICTPGEVRNRRCTCSTQYEYEICESGRRWRTVSGTCPSGQICENGYCVSRCSEGWLDNYRCSGNSLQREYRYSDCRKEWKEVQSCYYGCENNRCNSKPSCESGYGDEYRCSGNWRQGLYKYSDCGTEWKNWEYCDYGCESGHCLPKPCEPCKTCECGECDRCREPCYRECNIHVSVDTPGDAFVGDSVNAKVKIENYGGSGRSVHFDAYMCTDDGYCRAMNCDGVDPTVYVPADGTREFTCRLRAEEACSHKIKVVYSACGADPTVYSDAFEVKKAKCAEGYLNEYMCVNDWKMRKYQLKDCTNVWKQYELCTYGCAVDKCVEPPARKAVPLISIEDKMEVKSCESSEFTFKIKNVGDKEGKFKLVGGGELAEWVFFQPTITLNPDQEETITAYTSIPCEATGTHDFTVKALSDGESSATSHLTVTKEQEEFPTGYFPSLGYLREGFAYLLVIAFFVLFIFWLFKWRTTSRKSPECFRCSKGFKVKF